MTITAKRVRLDDAVVMANQSMLDRLAPWALVGKGAFETMRSYSGTIFLLDDHLKRLFQSLKALNIPSPYSKSQIQTYLYDLLKANRLSNARMRLTVWHEKRQTHLSIVTSSYRPFRKRQYYKGFQGCISRIRRDERSILCQIKSIHYQPFLNAYNEALNNGYDEAILLNRKGHIVEGSRTNVFFAHNGVLCTPKLTCGCLNGITRQAVLKLAKESKIPVKQTAAFKERILAADEAFLTNSTMEIMPLTSIQKQKIGDGTPGTLTMKLSKRYGKLTP